MSAPAAPHIRAMQNSEMIRVAWKPVNDATDYNIYMGSTANPTGLEDSVNYTEAESDGAFTWWSGPQAGLTFVRITSLNSLAEESGYSNEREFIVNADSDNDPTPALDHIRKGA